ncbi:unnamed protein product [Prorocentrum cordatum]|uniref:RNA helicase n=1 Tax=Prorocentrum cordatum TaxID=2364126 RepID=A0ABN9W4K6_9DINO|nr:unnamed protein product [Polarella glacialis]
MQLSRLEAGAPVEIRGLVGRPELNGQVALLAEPFPEEVEAYPDRRVVVLGTGERVALRPVCLGFPSYRLGDAVTLETQFAGEEEGLEGRAAVVSELTHEEQELGMGRYGGRVVVDVLPVVLGGPVVHRLLMWPEHLMPRSYVPGDSVELRGLESAASLNGAAATVVPPSAEEASAVQGDGGERRIVVSLDADGTRLAVRKDSRAAALACVWDWRQAREFREGP